jgi:predicted DNA binding protein
VTGSLLAEFTLASPVFADALAACPDTRVAYVQEAIPVDRAAWMAVRVVGDASNFEAAMDDDVTVADYERLATADDRTLYRIEVADEARSKLTYGSFVDADGVALSSVADADGWHVRARFPDREALARHCDRCRAMGVGFELDSVYTADETGEGSLTGPQRKALSTALEMGYFSVPREATAGDVADRLGITKQAVSERLRRAMETAALRALGKE